MAIAVRPGSRTKEPGRWLGGMTFPISNDADTHFYWRARVPVRFSRMPREARLSFSLRLSDHRKATYIAQRLNTLLADLTVRPTAAMTTKDQLEQIFRAEIERMNAYLEDIAFAARRAGSTEDVREMEADLEVGCDVAPSA